MELFIEGEKDIWTKVDASGGKWPVPAVNGLFKIACKCLKVRYADRATIAEVYTLSKDIAAI